jgi:2-polyprenyl-6-methoxyphenol hydroxylase-like FAD-dependent oxidoreductase
MSPRYRIGIVGFGVAGATAACFLARAEHEVTVIERAPVMQPIGAGILLQVSGQQVLQRLGLLDAVVQRAAPLEELYARHQTGELLIRTRYPDFEPACRAYGVHRGVIFGVLHDAVASLPIDVRLGREVIGREVEPGRVFLRDHLGDRHGPFDLVICADGSRSHLRAACGMRARVQEYPLGALWVTAPTTVRRTGLLQVVRGNAKLLGLLPLGDGLTTLFWGMPVREFESLERRGLESLKGEILAFCPEASEVLDCVVDHGQLIRTSYRHVWLNRWFDRHTIFIGDACHAMSPHLGQGMNLAMVDACRLADALSNARDSVSAFRRFREKQRGYIRYYSVVTWLLSPFFQSEWPFLGWGRDRFLPLLPYVPWVKGQMLLTVTGLKGGFLQGRISI